MERNLLKKMARDENGMTLIEIIAVLTIIVAIMYMVGQNVTKQLQRGKVLSAKTQLKLLEQGLEDYYRDNDSYPTTAQGLDALFHKPSTGKDKPDWSGPYLRGNKAPKDPWNNEYVYISEDGQKFILMSLGRGGKEGGNDFEADITVENQ